MESVMRVLVASRISVEYLLDRDIRHDFPHREPPVIRGGKREAFQLGDSGVVEVDNREVLRHLGVVFSAAWMR